MGEPVQGLGWTRCFLLHGAGSTELLWECRGDDGGFRADVPMTDSLEGRSQ